MTIHIAGITALLFGCHGPKDNKGVSTLAGNPTGSTSKKDNPPGMAWIPGGEFTMGTDDPE